MWNADMRKIRRHFPHDDMRPVQEEAFRFLISNSGGIVELPTGSGKTAVGMGSLLAHRGNGPLFYVTPTKALVEQVERLFPEHVCHIYGRSEYPCLYYTDRGQDVNAQESPCYMLRCPHRVDQSTGRVEEEGAEPCPYYQQKFQAVQTAEAGGVVLCTTAFFLMNRLLVRQWKDGDPTLVVLDEVHGLAKVARRLFEYTMSDWHLRRVAEAVTQIDPDIGGIIRRFYSVFYRMAVRHSPRTPTLLQEREIVRLLEILEELSGHRSRLETLVREAVDGGVLDPVGDRETIKLLENLVKNIPRYVLSFRYALADGERQHPLNYVVAFYFQRNDPEFVESERRARYYLTIRSYYVAPLIRKCVNGNVVAYSATIGNPNILRNETGLEMPFRSFGSNFDAANTRIFLPTDVPNLSQRKRQKGDLNKVIRRIIRTSQQFLEHGHRSLVVVVSEEERAKFLQFAAEEGLEGIVSYGNNGLTAREAARQFSSGEGSVLLGTTAQYGEGLDLPDRLAPIIFFLRPGYQRPDDPETQFEERRFGQSHCWKLWNWRVMIQALQVRGRNIRNSEDVGVCFFMSQQFHDFLYGSLPEWLQPAYRGKLTMEQAVQETLGLL